ncbi:MAG: sodium-translocating pyrophosphatase [Deltaproteobacteria bacterium]|nr:sodium-translocating pyrophosphatase [Deltaproteobacteria bacterium]MBI3295048.1 sodium-translocating pyrophosphatase [Deltaproteobacteria bacterium]
MELVLIFGISFLALAFAFYLASYVMKQDTGTEKMRFISDAIKSGAEAFLRRMNKTIALLSIVVAVALYLFYNNHKGPDLAWKITLGFLAGAFSSALAGFIGMMISIRSNIRTASAAMKSLNLALKVSLRGGAVSGLAVTAMSLLGVAGLFVLFGGRTDLPAAQLKEIALQVVGYGFGASFVALFAQLGGGIYTKAADVGADLVGKVEAGIPEDDPRNPAVIADLVGDNVGDCAGRGADLFESTAAENVGAMVLGAFLATKHPELGVGVVFFPLVARAFGIIASIIGIFMVRMKNENEDPMSALNRGYNITSVLAMIGFYFAVRWLLNFPGNMWFFASGCIGVVTSYIFVLITQYYTEYKFRPVKSIADSCLTGPATNIITGIAVGLECTAAPVVVISTAIFTSYYCGEQALSGGGLFGTAVATMGMLSTAAYILAMDTFGPITDNAGGIIEMSGQPEDIRKRTDRLDSVGNTTKALTKGYAIGSAALAAFLLFSAYLDEVSDLLGREFHSVDLAKVPVFIGALLGAALVFLFSALAIKAVGNVAQFVIQEVRRQFRENKGIMAGTSQPDYGKCVDIVTVGALKAMVAPGLLAVLVPLFVGVTFKYMSSTPGMGAEAVAAFLMVGTIAGILMATFMNNGGGAWDNAKKYIETGVHGGKKSDAHKAAVVGDTVGDPFKDTAGPSLHVLIKMLSTITLLLAPLFI